MGTKEIEQRIEGRKTAEELFEEYCHGEDPAWIEGFARACYAFAEKRLPRQPSEVMTTTEAKVFETEKLQFGKHSGEFIGDIPMSYLNWLADNNRPMIKYVDSQRGIERAEEEMSDG